MTCKWINACPMRELEKKGIINDKYKKEYCLSKNNWKNCKRYKLEEKGIAHPDNLLPDNKLIKI